MGEQAFTSMAAGEDAVDVPRVGIGMLGYAFMGKAHSNAYKTIPYMMYPPPAIPELVAICGRDQAAVAEAAARYGFDRSYTDWRAMLEDDRVQLFDNGGPNDAHAEPLGFGNARRKHFRRAVAILEGDEVGTDLVQGPYVVDRFLAVMHAAVAHTRPVIVGPVGVRAGTVERHRGLVEPWTTENTVIDRIAYSQTLIVAPGTDHGGGHAPVQEGFAIHPIPVRLGVHQARKHPFPAGVDDLRPGRNLNLTGWAHSGDPVALHDDYGILNRRPAKAVDQGPPLNDKGALLLSPGAVGQRRAQCHQDCASHQHSA
ncbi:MAG: hypothetical protein IID54_03150 [Proteobacteria bacterium]|nr:hypothetical protein [Pseudomonadota bacterium]